MPLKADVYLETALLALRRVPLFLGSTRAGDLLVAIEALLTKMPIR